MVRVVQGVRDGVKGTERELLPYMVMDTDGVYGMGTNGKVPTRGVWHGTLIRWSYKGCMAWYTDQMVLQGVYDRVH